MPMWARAIFFGLELIGFLVFCIFATWKFYKRDKQKAMDVESSEHTEYYKECCKKEVKENLRSDIIYFTINFVIILAIFLFTFSSFVFLSYSKLIFLSGLIITSILFAIAAWIDKSLLFVFACIVGVLSSVITMPMASYLNLDDKVIISEQTEPEIQRIEPIMVSVNQIGYTCDNDGNIETYCYYYEQDGQWYFEEIEADDAEIIDIQDADVYVEKATTVTEYIKKEKKPSADDYRVTETESTYRIYASKDQMVEIKTD